MNEIKEQNQTNKNHSRVIFTFIALPILLLILFGCTCILSRNAADRLMISDPLEITDAAIVLSGNDDTRLQEAVDLYLDRMVKNVVITDVGVDLEEFNSDYTSEIRFELINMGVAPTQLFVTDHIVESTEDEAHAAFDIIREYNWKSVTVITDPYHTYRTRLIFNKIFEGQDIQVYIRPVRDHWYNPSTWWMSLEGWKVTFLEYIKLINFYLD